MNNDDISNLINNLSQSLNKDGNSQNALNDLISNFKNQTSSASSSNTSNNSNSSDQSSDIFAKLSNMINSSQSSSNPTTQNNETSSPSIDIGMLLKMKSIIEKMNTNENDPRTKLLLSLKPYLRDNRKDKVEQYVKLFNMTKVLDILNIDGGDKPN